MRSVARSKGELGAVGRVCLVATLIATVASCAAQPVAPRRGLLPPGAIPLVSHLAPPLRILMLVVSVDGSRPLVYNGSNDPLPAYIVMPRRLHAGVHRLRLYVSVALPCFLSGPPVETEQIRVTALFAGAAPPPRIELFHGPGARSTGTGIHVRVVGALRPADLSAHHPPAPELPSSITSQGCVRDVLRVMDNRLAAARAHCDVDRLDFLLGEQDSFLRWLAQVPDGAMSESRTEEVRQRFVGLPDEASRVAFVCRTFTSLPWFGWIEGDRDDDGPQCPWGEERTTRRWCDAYRDPDMPR